MSQNHATIMAYSNKDIIHAIYIIPYNGNKYGIQNDLYAFIFIQCTFMWYCDSGAT